MDSNLESSVNNGRAFLIKCLANKRVAEVAQEIGVRSDQMYHWINGKHVIYSKAARKLGRYFHVGPENFMDQWYETTGSTFGCEIRRWRLRMGLSMVDLAVRLGYCEKTICNWENDHIKKDKENEIRMLLESVESHLPENF